MDKIIKCIDLSNIKTKNDHMNWTDSVGAKIPFIYDDISGEINLIDYKNNKVLLEYNGYQKWMRTGHLRAGKIGELIGKNTVRFKYEIGQIIKSDSVDITIIDRKYEKHKHGKAIINDKYYKYKCNKCGFACGEYYKVGNYYEEFWILESDLLQGNGCSCCCATPQIVVNGINDIPTTDPWMVDYFQGGYNEAKKYMKSGNTKLYPICPNCGKIKGKKMSLNTINSLHGIGCTCGDGISYPEKYLSNLLDQLNVKYIKELTKTIFSWCGDYRYDFYLEEYNCIIETHGIQHYIQTTGNFNSDKLLEDRMKIDEDKEFIAKQNGILEYIVIDCRYSNYEWIKNSILASKLNQIFNLKKVSFKECAEYANSNIKKKVCDYYNIYRYRGRKHIADHFNLSPTTISVYLKEGNDIGWCKYNKTSFSRKQIYVYDSYKNCIGIFDDAQNLSERSIEIFGKYMSKKSIMYMCSNYTNQLKNYIFSYTPLESQANDSLLLCSNE